MRRANMTEAEETLRGILLDSAELDYVELVLPFGDVEALLTALTVVAELDDWELDEIRVEGPPQSETLPGIGGP